MRIKAGAPVSDGADTVPNNEAPAYDTDQAIAELRIETQGMRSDIRLFLEAQRVRDEMQHRMLSDVLDRFLALGQSVIDHEHRIKALENGKL